jgi:glucosamine--fructose-6-phosphate aminotransferase (isomerizing)
VARIWQDTLELPETLQTTLDRADGFAETAALLGRREVRRIVATGNGAAYYVAHALWLASLEGRSAAAELLAVPGGLVARGRFSWRSGDALLVVSSSGEFRDVIEAIREGSAPRPYAAITATRDSTIGRGAGARALVHVAHQRAVTHTQAFCGNILAALAIWAEVTDDPELEHAVSGAPEACARALAGAESWAASAADEAAAPPAAVAFGSGPAWSAALETALLLKEVARLPAEGVETREGATSAMTGLAPGHLVLSLPTDDDPIVQEAEATCRATGATVLRVPGGAEADRRLAAITTFPAALALAAELGRRAGLDVDAPWWTDAYYSTARAAT